MTGIRSLMHPRFIKGSAWLPLAMFLATAFLASGCAPEAPSNSATVTTASDLKGHRYVDLERGVELVVLSDNNLVFSRWDSDSKSEMPYEFRGSRLVIDTSEGGSMPRSLTLVKTAEGGWKGDLGGGVPVQLVPVTPEVEQQIVAANAEKQEREDLLGGRPSSDADYYPVKTDIEWSMLYASRQKGWTDEELADFLIPGHHNEPDAFKKRELFEQLPAIKVDLQAWSERTDFVFEDADSTIRHFSLAGSYAFESSGFPVRGSVCNGNTVFGPARLSFIEWEPANCVVPVDEATARRVEQSRAASQSLITSKIYFRAIGIVNQNLQADAHKADLTIWHRPDYTSDFSGMETLAEVTVKKAQPN